MEDMERYGDYNEVDEAPGGSKNPVARALKILIVTLCLLVVGLIIFRVVLFNYYPKAMKRIYFNDELTAYYHANDGEIGAKTQSLRAPYDDPDFSSFMADNLIIIEGAGQLQLSIRYNSSIFDTIEEKYGVRLEDNGDLFRFSLERVPFSDDNGNTEAAYTIGELDYATSDTFAMYTYYKLVFDGVQFLPDGTSDWIRLKITINGMPEAAPYYILVYENTETYSAFDDYDVSSKEAPDA